MPSNKLTQMESEIFFDIAHGSQAAIMEFLYIRNRLLQAWLADPTVELTCEKAQAAVILPQPGQLVSQSAVADPGFGKGGFMRMCTVATMPPFDAHAHRCNGSGCCCFKFNGL